MFSFQWVHMKTVTSYLTFQVCSEVWCVLHICTQGQWGLGTCHGLLSHTELAAPSWTAQLTAWACGGRGASSISVHDAATLRSLSASRWGHSPTPGDWTRLGLPQAAVGHWQRGASVRWRTGYRTIRSEVGLDWSPNLWELQSTTEPLKTIFFFFFTTAVFQPIPSACKLDLGTLPPGQVPTSQRTEQPRVETTACFLQNTSPTPAQAWLSLLPHRFSREPGAARGKWCFLKSQTAEKFFLLLCKLWGSPENVVDIK